MTEQHVAHGRVERGERCLLHKGDVVRELRNEPARRLPSQPREVRPHEMLERDLLHVRRHAHDDAVGLDRLQVEEQAAQHRHGDDGAEHVGQRRVLLLHQGVKGGFDDHRVGASRGREQRGEDERPDQLAPARRHPVATEPFQKAALMLVERQRLGRRLYRLRAVRRHDGAWASAATAGCSGSSSRCIWTMK